MAIIEEHLVIEGRIETLGGKRAMVLCHPLQSIYTEGEMWTTQSLGML